MNPAEATPEERFFAASTVFFDHFPAEDDWEDFEACNKLARGPLLESVKEMKRLAMEAKSVILLLYARACDEELGGLMQILMQRRIARDMQSGLVAGVPGGPPLGGWRK